MLYLGISIKINKATRVAFWYIIIPRNHDLIEYKGFMEKNSNLKK
jgi:hypothetical protein